MGTNTSTSNEELAFATSCDACRVVTSLLSSCIFWIKVKYSLITCFKGETMLSNRVFTSLRILRPLISITSASFVNSICYLGLWAKYLCSTWSKFSIFWNTGKWDNSFTMRLVMWLTQWTPFMWGVMVYILQELCRIPSRPMHPTHTYIKYLCAIWNEKYKGQFDFYVHYDCT